MENRSHALMTGFFTIALVVASVLAGIWLNRDRVQRVPYLLLTTLSVPGLNPQAAVRYRGLEVGKVDSLGFDPALPGQIMVRLSVDPDTPVTTSTFATLGYQGVTGIAYVQLDDEATGSPMLRSDAAHPARIALRPGLMDQLETRGRAILAQTEALTARANALTSPANQKVLLAAVENVGKTAVAFGALAERLGPTVARLPALTASAERAIVAFGGFSDDAHQTANNWDRLGTTLQAKGGTLEQWTTVAERIAGSVDTLAVDVSAQILPQVNATADEARRSLRAVGRAVNQLSARPQSLLLGAPVATPGPGEAGFAAPTK